MNRLIALFCSTLLLPVLARADVTATAQITNFRTTVIDLAPEDGIAAGFSHRSYQAYQRAENFDTTFEGSGAPNFAYAQRYDGAYSQSVSIDGLVDAALSSRSSASPLTQGDELGNYLFYDMTMRIAPHTSVQIELDFSGNVTRTGQDTGFLFGRPVAGIHSYFTGGLDDSAGALEPFVQGTEENWNKTLSISFINDTDQIRDAEYRVSLSANVQYLYQVPEPSMYAMLGAGLLMLAATARRRKAVLGT